MTKQNDSTTETESQHAKREIDLARQVVDWLQLQHWDVYQEVQVHTYDRIADIVAVLGPLVWVIECKLTLSLGLIEQAVHWRAFANCVSVAVPPSSNVRVRSMAKRVLKWQGIGLFNVRLQVYESVAPALNRRVDTSVLRAALHEEQKSFALAGNNEGQRWSPFAQTCNELRKIVMEQPGIEFRDAMDLICHHYSSTSTARSALTQWLHRDAVRGVRVMREGRRLALYPSRSEKTA